MPSPILLARNKLHHAGLSKTTRLQLKRIYTAIPETFVEILDQEDVSYRMCRWIAWGCRLQDRAIRLGLVILLRNKATATTRGPRSVQGWYWPKDTIMSTFERVFLKSPQYKHLIKMRIVAETPVAGTLFTLTETWQPTWRSILAVMRTLDKDKLLTEIRLSMPRASKRRSRKQTTPVQLSYKARRILDALKVVRVGIMKGHISPDLVDEILDADDRLVYDEACEYNTTREQDETRVFLQQLAKLGQDNMLNA